MSDPDFKLEALKRCVDRLRKLSGDQFAERMARALEHSLAMHTLGVKAGQSGPGAASNSQSGNETER